MRHLVFLIILWKNVIIIEQNGCNKKNEDGTYILCNTYNIYEKTKLTYGKNYHSFYISDYYNIIIINIKNNENSILKYIERSNNINTMRKM